MVCVLPIYPANVWTGFIDGAAQSILIEVTASAITSIQLARFLCHVNKLTTATTACAWECRCHDFANWLSHERVL